MRQIKALDGKVITVMNKLSFFRNFNLSEKQSIVDKRGCIMIADKDEEIIVQGKEDASFYLVLSGELEVVLKEKDKNISIAKIHPDDFVGEMSFLTGAPRSTSVFARKESTMLFKIDKIILQSLSVIVREKIKDMVIKKLVERINDLNQQLAKRAEAQPGVTKQEPNTGLENQPEANPT